MRECFALLFRHSTRVDVEVGEGQGLRQDKHKRATFLENIEPQRFVRPHVEREKKRHDEQENRAQHLQRTAQINNPKHNNAKLPEHCNHFPRHDNAAARRRVPGVEKAKRAGRTRIVRCNQVSGAIDHNKGYGGDAERVDQRPQRAKDDVDDVLRREACFCQIFHKVARSFD